MKRTFLRLALFAGLLFAASVRVEAAALSVASLQGAYFFALQRIDSAFVPGPSFTTAKGTLTFDQKGGIAVQGVVNQNGTLQTLSTRGTYTLAASGDLQISLPGTAFPVTGSVSFDLNVLLASNAAMGNLFTQEILVATRQAPSNASGSPSFLQGPYFLSERTTTVSSGSPQLETSVGTVTFDGQGSYSSALSKNGNGSVTSVNSNGTYQMSADGTVSLTLPGRSTPVQLGFTPDANVGTGATVLQQSANTHDLFVLTKASSDGLGNAGLNGSYSVVVGTAGILTGFSTTAGQADYMGDGSVRYRTQRSNTNSSTPGTVLVNADSSLQFGFATTAPRTYRGGLGTSGHTLIASSTSDPTSFDFFVAVRTPSQPNAAVNAATFLGVGALTPGALVSVFGKNLARQTLLASQLPLPTTLGGASLKIGGVAAPLLFVSPFQVNAQVPFGTLVSDVPITVVLNGVESGPLTATVTNTGPGIFTVSSDGNGAGIFLHGADFSPVTQASPARPGEVVLIYCTGLGAVLPQVADGAAAPGDPISKASASVSVKIGGQDAGAPDFAGLAPGFVGLYQVNIKIPQDAPLGPNLPVVVTAAGVQSKAVTIPIAPAQ